MEPQTHPDPFAEAAGHGLQRAIQIASSAATGAQVLAYYQRDRTAKRAQVGELERRALDAQMRAERAAARVSLAAMKPDWMKDASFAQAAHAWGLSMPYADPATPWYETLGATIMRRAEERLRVLHPTAMARYDRLRSEGLEPGEAMRQAAPMFGYPPRAHNPPYTPPRALTTPAAPARPDAGQPWRQDFPLPINDVLTATAAGESAAASPAGPAVPAPRTHTGRQP